MGKEWDEEKKKKMKENRFQEANGRSRRESESRVRIEEGKS